MVVVVVVVMGGDGGTLLTGLGCWLDGSQAKETRSLRGSCVPRCGG